MTNTLRIERTGIFKNYYFIESEILERSIKKNIYIKLRNKANEFNEFLVAPCSV